MSNPKHPNSLPKTPANSMGPSGEDIFRKLAKSYQEQAGSALQQEHKNQLSPLSGSDTPAQRSPKPEPRQLDSAVPAPGDPLSSPPSGDWTPSRRAIRRLDRRIGQIRRSQARQAAHPDAAAPDTALRRHPESALPNPGTADSPLRDSETRASKRSFPRFFALAAAGILLLVLARPLWALLFPGNPKAGTARSAASQTEILTAEALEEAGSRAEALEEAGSRAEALEGIGSAEALLPGDFSSGEPFQTPSAPEDPSTKAHETIIDHDLTDHPQEEAIPLSFPLPEGFRIIRTRTDRGVTLYTLENHLRDPVILSLSPSPEDVSPWGDPSLQPPDSPDTDSPSQNTTPPVPASATDPPAFRSLTLYGHELSFAADCGYQLISFSFEGISYRLSCRYDLNTLLPLCQSILSA